MEKVNPIHIISESCECLIPNNCDCCQKKVRAQKKKNIVWKVMVVERLILLVFLLGSCLGDLVDLVDLVDVLTGTDAGAKTGQKGQTAPFVLIIYWSYAFYASNAD